MWDINQQFLISIAIIAIGYLVKRLGLISKKEGATLSAIIFNLTLPALILVTFAEMTVEAELLWLAVIGILFGIGLLLMNRLIFRREAKQDQGVFVISLIGFNIGLFVYPFVETIWGAEGLKHMAFFDMGNAVLIFGLAYIAAGMYAPGDQKIEVRVIMRKLFTFFPMLAYLAALVISFSNVPIPDFGLELLGTVASANSVLVLLLLGIYLEFQLKRSLWKPFMKVLLIKYGIGLTAGLILYMTLPFDPMFRATILLGFVLPAGMSVIPYAVQHKLNTELAAGIVNLTNIISFGFIWVIFLVLT